MSDHLLSAALQYAKRGWLVLPLHSPKGAGCSCGKPGCTKAGKHPRTPSGLSDASTDEHQIRRWWDKWPEANIGIVTGAKSGLVVIDLDNGGGKQGEDNFTTLERGLGGLPQTLTAQTGRGKHLFLRHPGISLKNSVSQIAPGVDVRADGGYVVAAPSTHASGRRYEWEDEEAPIAEVPVWLLAMVAGKRDAMRTPNENQIDSPHGAAIPEGRRNDTLYRVGCSLRGQLAMEHREIVQRLMLYNEAKCVPPLEESEVLAIAESVCKHPPESGGKRSGNRQERNPLYWFKLNTREFGADLNIQRMTDYQLGWHTKLRVYAWQNGGILPADESTLWRLAGAKSRKMFDRDSGLVLADYQPVTLLHEQVLLNRRMAAEYADVLEQWLKLKAAGEANRDRLRSMSPMTSAFDSLSAQTIQ